MTGWRGKKSIFFKVYTKASGNVIVENLFHDWLRIKIRNQLTHVIDWLSK